MNKDLNLLGKWRSRAKNRPELAELEKVTTNLKQSTITDFQGGAIGFISYDYARTIKVLPNEAQDDLKVPDTFLLFDQWAVHNVKRTK